MHCTYDPATRGGNAPDGRKVKATIHWVSAAARGRRRGAALRQPVHEGESERRARGPGLHGEPESELAGGARGREAGAVAGERRSRASAISSSGWDTSASIRIRQPGTLVFNRTVALRDTWAKIEKREKTS